MFPKRAKQTPPSSPPTGDGNQTEQAGPDPRDAAIERLERELAEQRDAAKGLREALDASSFKAEILEKSYAKQLADTREKLAATERQLAEKTQVLGALDGGHEDALRALNEARAELKLLTAERDQLRKQIAGGGFKHDREQAQTRAPLAALDDTSGGTINQLIANAGQAEKKPTAGSGHGSAQVAEQETPHEEMLAPELVFTTKDKDER
jgi:hypothetical protein